LRRPQPTLPDFILHLPWVGALLQNWLTQHISDPAQFKQNLAHWLQTGASHVLVLLGGVGRNAAKFALALITLFFFYRDGETVLHQVRSALHHLVGSRIDDYLRAAGSISRMIVQSAVLAALLQGLVAGAGYWIIGVQTPALLGVATTLASVIPFFGTTLIWGPVSISLLVNGNLWQGIAMLAWGVLLIHPIDNIIRPLLISTAAKIPFLLTMFGALGGIAAFGLIGLFLGPVILAVAIAVWREWISAIDSASSTSKSD
jgi:predicted PurR-regulated permease PerM